MYPSIYYLHHIICGYLPGRLLKTFPKNMCGPESTVKGYVFQIYARYREKGLILRVFLPKRVYKSHFLIVKNNDSRFFFEKPRPILNIFAVKGYIIRPEFPVKGSVFTDEGTRKWVLPLNLGPHILWEISWVVSPGDAFWNVEIIIISTEDQLKSH